MHKHMLSVCGSAITGINFQGFDAFELTLFKFLLGMHALVDDEQQCFPHHAGQMYQVKHLTVKDSVLQDAASSSASSFFPCVTRHIRGKSNHIHSLKNV